MYRKAHVVPTVIAAAALSLSATLAFADDSSISVLTGDSYAYFNNLDYNPGHFNTARAPVANQRNASGEAAQKARDSAEAQPSAADRARATLRNLFRDKGA